MDHSRRILIIDDHRMVRAGLRFALQLFPDLEVVGEASNSSDALTMTSLVAPDVALIDLDMPDDGCVATTGALLQARPEIRVLAVAGTYSTRRMIMDAIHAGVAACIDQYLSIDELAVAIRTV